MSITSLLLIFIDLLFNSILIYQLVHSVHVKSGPLEHSTPVGLDDITQDYTTHQDVEAFYRP